MVSVEIENIINAQYPINVYISDIYVNNNYLIGIINTNPFPSGAVFDTTIPSIFNSIDTILVWMIDSNQCESFKLVECGGGDILQIKIQ